MGRVLYGVTYISSSVAGLFFWLIILITNERNLTLQFFWGAVAAAIFTIPLVLIARWRGQTVGKPKLHYLAVTALMLSVGAQLFIPVLSVSEDYIGQGWTFLLALAFFYVVMPVVIVAISILHITCFISGLGAGSSGTGRTGRPLSCPPKTLPYIVSKFVPDATAIH